MQKSLREVVENVDGIRKDYEVMKCGGKMQKKYYAKNRQTRFCLFLRQAMAWALIVMLVVSGMVGWQTEKVQAATRKPVKITLSKKAVSTTVGSKVKLKVKSVSPQKASKNVTWKSSDKKLRS